MRIILSAMDTIYILHCQDNRYYIGRTKNILERFQKHKRGLGAEWTKLYRPKAILDILPDSPFEELRQTLMYMQQYGIENVRGGPWCQVEMSASDTNQILKFLQAETFARTETTEVAKDIPVPPNRFQRHGCVWEAQEIEQLLDSMRNCISLTDISLQLRRKESAVRSYVTKLVKSYQQKNHGLEEISKLTNLTVTDIENALSCHGTVEMKEYARAMIV